MISDSDVDFGPVLQPVYDVCRFAHTHNKPSERMNADRLMHLTAEQCVVSAS